MSPRQRTLTAIQQSFAGQEELVARAFRDSRSFRELCEHYLQCRAALSHWEQLQAPEAAVRLREYAELREELAREIRTWLDGMRICEPSSRVRPT